MKKHSEATQTLRTHKQTQTNRQGQLQYTAQLSVQCKDASYVRNGTLENF